MHCRYKILVKVIVAVISEVTEAVARKAQNKI